MKNRKFWLLIILSVIVGAINGLLGGGGGMLCVPLFVYGYGLKQKEAHASAIFVMFISSIASAFVYITAVHVNFLNLVFLAGGTLIGGVVGAFLLKKLNTKFVKGLFAALMFFAGIMMVIKK